MNRLLAAFGWMVKLFGGWERGLANIKNHKTVINRVQIPRLPDRFNGLKVLHLSDLHLDVFEGMGAHLGKICSKLQFDLVLITGDYRFHTHSNYYPVFKELQTLVKNLHCRFGIYGILGNHDFLEFVPKLESAGIRMLLNESVRIENEGEHIWVVGLDDAHFYGVHDYPKAFDGIDPDETKLLLIHSPETLESAHTYSTDFVLAGHTHAGQVCLPGGTAIWLNADCPRKYCVGAWDYKGMPGYTSSGAGSSGLPIRFNCQPEVTVHHLVTGRSKV
jgi:predicted MPP superfamily phosphohydrolase